MEIRPIRTHEDYEATLREIEGLMDAAPDSPEGGVHEAAGRRAAAAWTGNGR